MLLKLGETPELFKVSWLHLVLEDLKPTFAPVKVMY